MNVAKMNNDSFKQLLKISRSSNHQEQIVSSVLNRMEKMRLLQMRIRALIYALFTLGTIVSFKPAINLLIDGVLSTGFADYFMLALSGGLAYANTWRHVTLSLIEALPIIETTTIIGLAFIFIYSLRHITLLFKEISTYEHRHIHSRPPIQIKNV